MYTTIPEEIFFKKILTIKKKYSKREINLHNYFYSKTKIYPKNVIIVRNFVFFFVDKEFYFRTKMFLKAFRKDLKKKTMIISHQKILINLIFSFFPDIYIHDIKLEFNENLGLKEVKIYFLSFEERGIAVGTSGEYIKAVNEFFEKNIVFEELTCPIKVTCELCELEKTKW